MACSPYGARGALALAVYEHRPRPAGTLMTIAFELKREQFVALNGRPAEPGYHFCRNREHTPLRGLSYHLTTRLPASEDAQLELECLKHSSI